MTHFTQLQTALAFVIAPGQKYLSDPWAVGVSTSEWNQVELHFNGIARLSSNSQPAAFQQIICIHQNPTSSVFTELDKITSIYHTWQNRQYSTNPTKSPKLIDSYKILRFPQTQQNNQYSANLTKSSVLKKTPTNQQCTVLCKSLSLTLFVLIQMTL